ncbi:MAG: ribonuclease HI [Thermofilaceae archaeon]
MITVYFDGLCEPVNPGGIAAYGFVVYRDGERIAAGKGIVGAGYKGDDVTNNVAEYTALIRALEWLIANGCAGSELVVKGDSQLVIRQLQGRYAVRSPRIAPLYRRAVELLSHFPRRRYVWIPREGNREADALSLEALREYIREHPEALSAYSERRWRAFLRSRGLERL